MNLQEISLEIRELLEQKRKELELTFVEEQHIYYMKDLDGVVKNNFPSVSKIIKKFYEPFDANGVAHRMSGGDEGRKKEILAEWKAAADYSTNMGSRVHYELEKYLINQHKDYKEVRKPIFEIDEEQKLKSDNMIKAGHDFLNLMKERDGVLLDTEIVLGDPEEEYTGQPDKVWLILNKDKNDFGFVLTDYKTNQPKNFEVQYYTKQMFQPFGKYPDTALSHYYLQLPLYARLLRKMLKGTKYEYKKFLGGVIVLLKDDGTFIEYRVPPEVNYAIFNLDLKKYIKR
jgi:hypothetical protein